MECESCGHAEPHYVCGACQDTAYCDKECQRADFEFHAEYDCIGKRTGRSSLKKRRAAKRAKVMREFYAGKLHSGSPKGPIVQSKKQALAIAYAEAKKLK